MKILFVHNNYASNNSGEEHASEGLASLLEKNGHIIKWFRKSSDIIKNSISNKISAFFSGIYNYNSVKELNVMLDEFQPDIVQIQNLYPFISPAILRGLKKRKIPIVMRTPNYRLFCPTGLHMDGSGNLCEKCLTRGRELHCVKKNCENDIFKSFGYALRNFIARKIWGVTKNIDAYIVQTNFQKQKFIENGISKNKLHIISGLMPKVETKKQTTIGTYVSFIGRVSKEKGIEEFLEAATKLPEIQFLVIGELQESDTHLIKKSSANVIWKGFVAGKDLDTLYEQSKIIVVPSKCYEGFPNVITRAMKHSKPVITSNLGAMSSIIDHEINGILVKPNDSEELANAIKKLFLDNEKCLLYGLSGKIKANELYSSSKVYQDLMMLYESVTKKV